ncbi:MAG: type II toxin-antitoxin system RelE family toxin [Candidatus Woesearchaeota archaeon]
MYRIAFTNTAHTQLGTLEKDTASRIADALERIRVRPGSARDSSDRRTIGCGLVTIG